MKVFEVVSGQEGHSVEWFCGAGAARKAAKGLAIENRDMVYRVFQRERNPQLTLREFVVAVLNAESPFSTESEIFAVTRPSMRRNKHAVNGKGSRKEAPPVVANEPAAAPVSTKSKKKGADRGKNPPKRQLAEAVEITEPASIEVAEATKMTTAVAETAPPKPRGRPKGSKNKPKGEAPKKRGRPKGSKNKPRAAPLATPINGAADTSATDIPVPVGDGFDSDGEWV